MEGINLYDETQVRNLFHLSRSVALRGSSSNGLTTKFEGILGDEYYTINHFNLPTSEEVSVSNDLWGVTFIEREGSEYEVTVTKGKSPDNIEEVLEKLKSVPHKEKPSFETRQRYYLFSNKKIKFG